MSDPKAGTYGIDPDGILVFAIDGRVNLSLTLTGPGARSVVLSFTQIQIRELITDMRTAALEAYHQDQRRGLG